MAPATLPYPKTAKGTPTAKTTPKSEAGVKKSRGTSVRNGIPSKPTRYNTFIKENHATVKADNPGLDSSELRGILSNMWKTHHTNPKSSNYDGPPVTRKRK
ncbi:MAG: hypothetical protein M1835_007449 [Candelina submexicana]|nr:MAG: hypothetical protein M1835_007449 [Candelina submexicana]